MVCLPNVSTQSIESGCKSIPISVSNINNCKDGLCYATTLATAAIDITNGRTQCLELIGDQISTTRLFVNISLVSSEQIQPAENCYYTDDVLADFRGRCGCAANIPVMCEYGTKCADITPLYPDGTVCVSGTHMDPQCVLSAAGAINTFCGKASFSARPRYKVCKLKPPRAPVASILISTPQGSSYWSYQSSASVLIASGSSINVTFANPSFTLRDSFDFVVSDLYYPSHTYGFDSSLVNDISTYDPYKIGWYKIGVPQKFDPNIVGRIWATVKDCRTSSFDVMWNMWWPTRIMSNNMDKMISVIDPRMRFNDGEANIGEVWYGSGDTVPNTDFFAMREGIISVGFQKPLQIKYVGKTYGGIVVPSNYFIYIATVGVYTNKNRIRTGAWEMHCEEIWRQQHTDPPYDYCGKFCYAESTNDRTEFTYFHSMDCSTTPVWETGVTMIRYMYWPTMVFADGFFQVSAGKYSSTVGYKTDGTETSLQVPTLGASLLVTVEIGNLTIKFNQLSVHPEITNCVQNDSSVAFDLRTKAAEGNVIVSLFPGITASRSFFAYKDKMRYSFPLTDTIQGNHTLMAMGDLGQSNCWLVLNKTYFTGNYTPSWSNVTGLPYNFASLLTGRNLPGFEELSPLLFAAAVVIGLIILVVVGIVIVAIVIAVWPYIYPIIAPMLNMIMFMRPKSSQNVNPQEIKIVNEIPQQTTTQQYVKSNNPKDARMEQTIRNVVRSQVEQGLVEESNEENEVQRQILLYRSRTY